MPTYQMSTHVVGDVDIVSMCSEGGRNAWAETGESDGGPDLFAAACAKTITNYQLSEEIMKRPTADAKVCKSPHTGPPSLAGRCPNIT